MAAGNATFVILSSQIMTYPRLLRGRLLPGAVDHVAAAASWHPRPRIQTPAGKEHFYKCKQCGKMVDMRQLDDVLFHETHAHRPDIQYGGSERLEGPGSR
jgi:hypothetical protein